MDLDDIRTPSGNRPLPDQQPGANSAPSPERTRMNTQQTSTDTTGGEQPSTDRQRGEHLDDCRHHHHGGPGGHRHFGRHGHGRHHGFGPGRWGGPPWAGERHRDDADDQRSDEGGPGRRFGGFRSMRRHQREAFAQAMARGFGPGGPGSGSGWGGGHRGGRGGRHPFGFGGPGGPDGPGFGPGGPGGRLRERFFERGELRYVILDLVNDQPRHGYDIIRALEEQFSGLYSPSPGTIYPSLQLLDDQGLVVSESADGKKVFRATDEGRAELAKRSDTLQAIRDRIGARPVFEAIGDIRPIVGELWDLGQTVMRAASRGDLADEERVERLREAIRRAREEIDTILTVPAEPSQAKPDPTADEPVVL